MLSSCPPRPERPGGTSFRRFTIVWDFDGTLLPMEPWDSEQELLVA